ncbi:MAG: protein translocase subunit SecD [Rickettsiales bacterium]|jgi:preprotein translocase subunit SecD|nr:protein translocase subunit SecD [Rickettsiales bacterium]
MVFASQQKVKILTIIDIHNMVIMVMNYTRTRLFTLLVASVILILISVGNFYDLGWFSSNRVRLGLDLRGGSQILLRIDYNEYIKEQLQTTIVDLRREFRKNKIHIVPRLKLQIEDDNKINYISLGNITDLKSVRNILKGINENLSVQQNKDDTIIIYESASLNNVKFRLLQQSIEIVRKRIDEVGTKEPIIQTQGQDRILVQVPGLDSPEELKNVLGKTAKMTFHFVSNNTYTDDNIPNNIMKLPLADYLENVFVEKEVILNGEYLDDSNATFNDGKPAVSFRFNSIGAKKFADITRKNIGRLLAIVLDNEVITAPRINTAILNGSGVITGNFTTQEANNTALLLRAGALPAPLEVIEERVVGPSLGEDSIKKGLNACAIGFIFVLIFMLFLYKGFGVLTDFILLINLATTLAILSLFNATLTLPGIAGIVLAVGMAVDTNVLIFERIKEEYSKTQKVYSSIESGFDFAWITIFDSNITTILISLILYIFGTGAVKGFALVLAIGIFASLFSGVLLTKLLLGIWLNKFKPTKINI